MSGVGIPRTILYYGRGEPLPEILHLQAGPFELDYQGGEIKSVRLGNHEILRHIYISVRDHLWTPIMPVVSESILEQEAKRFRIETGLEYFHEDVKFIGKSIIIGDEQGNIHFRFNGVARSGFSANRIGFCVLHPIRELAGKPCKVRHSDGSVESGIFPFNIAPHQPFFDIRTISYEVANGAMVEVGVDGEVFEMEDQRNWIDYSYKTYCWSVSAPYPRTIAEGTSISQSVSLKLLQNPPGQREEAEPHVLSINIAEQSTNKFPRIGLGVASHGLPLGDVELDRLRMLYISHLRVDLHISEPDYPQKLIRAKFEANALGVPLEIARFFSDNFSEEVQEFCTRLQSVQPRVCTWLLFHEIYT